MPGCWPSTAPANQPQGGQGGTVPPPYIFRVGGGGFWASLRVQKGPHTRRVFRARGLYTIKERLADLGRGAKCLKRLGFRGISAGAAYLVCRACVPRMPCLRTSYAVPAYLVCRACVPRMPCLRTSYAVPISAAERAACARPSASAGSYSVPSRRGRDRPGSQTPGSHPRLRDPGVLGSDSA